MGCIKIEKTMAWLSKMAFRQYKWPSGNFLVTLSIKCQYCNILLLYLKLLTLDQLMDSGNTLHGQSNL